MSPSTLHHPRLHLETCFARPNIQSLLITLVDILDLAGDLASNVWNSVRRLRTFRWWIWVWHWLRLLGLRLLRRLSNWCPWIGEIGDRAIVLDDGAIESWKHSFISSSLPEQIRWLARLAPLFCGPGIYPPHLLHRSSISAQGPKFDQIPVCA
jgi:hypothetical protein